MVCPGCGHAENPADALYCENCGQALTADADASAIGAQAAPAVVPEPSTATATAPQPEPAVDAFDAPTRELETPVPAARTAWTCACGQSNPADEAFCQACGDERPSAVARLEPGSVIGGYELVERLDEGEYSVRAMGAAETEGSLSLVCGAAQRVDELADLLTALGKPRDDLDAGAGLVPSVAAKGDDPACGRYVVLDSPAGAWQPLGEQALEFEPARAVLVQLLQLVDRSAVAGRLLLLTPAQVLNADGHILVPRPRAPMLPLTGPLLADPAFVPLELRTSGGAGGEIDAWRAGAFAAAATVRATTGNALGFPAGWHGLMARLLAESPPDRPATLDAVRKELDTADESRVVSAHNTAFRTDVGHHHPVNQDAGGVWTWQRSDGTPLTLAVVADGVSAGERSEEASALTVELLHQSLESHCNDPDLDLDKAEQLMLQAGIEANEQIAAMPYTDVEAANATTLVAVCLLGSTAAGIWCGDSRAYGVTPEGCRALTRDHSWVNIMVDAGRMSLEEAKADPRAHVIARWLGVAEPPRDDPGFDRFRRELAAGDRLLVCSDGLYMYFDEPVGSEAEMAALACAPDRSVSAAVDDLIQTALDRGGFDNITAVLVALQ